MTTSSLKKPLGLTLQEAALISRPQIELALQDQATFEHLRLGEILALRGWIKQETADFFAEEWPNLVTNPQGKPIGYYLKAAGLLDDNQVETILYDQQLLKQKFGSTAVLKGWLKKRTIQYFLENLYAQNSQKKAIYHPSIKYSEEFVEKSPQKADLIYINHNQSLEIDDFIIDEKELDFIAKEKTSFLYLDKPQILKTDDFIVEDTETDLVYIETLLL